MERGIRTPHVGRGPRSAAVKCDTARSRTATRLMTVMVAVVQQAVRSVVWQES